MSSVCSETAEAKPVKQETSSTVILSPNSESSLDSPTQNKFFWYRFSERKNSLSYYRAEIDKEDSTENIPV